MDEHISFSQLRRNASLTLDDVSRYLNETSDTVSRLELGLAKPSLGIVRALQFEASLLGKSIDPPSQNIENKTLSIEIGLKQKSQLPPTSRPTVFADETGSLYASKVDEAHRKTHGLYLTPIALADFASQLISGIQDKIRILDPAAGAGVLLCAAVENIIGRKNPPEIISLVAFEIDFELCKVLSENLLGLVKWASTQNVKVEFTIERQDFVIFHNEVLLESGHLLSPKEIRQSFDIVIANPPYFKLNKSDERAQSAASVISGQPNIYGLFMAIGAELLKHQGELIYIVPRSFASGSYFQKFRTWFFERIRPELIHIFGSRRDAFARDDVLQENIVFKGVKEDLHIRKPNERIVVSSSAGLKDLSTPTLHTVKTSTALDKRLNDIILRLPTSDTDEQVLETVDSWSFTLGKLGLKISTGPVVPFRSTELIDASGCVPSTHAPLLWMNHVRAMEVKWPLQKHKSEYIKITENSSPLLVPNLNYVLVRRFSTKEENRRLVAGPYLARMFDTQFVGLENHLNYIYRPNGNMSENEVIGLTALLSSRLLDTYFRISNGNTQVSATELRAMPFPNSSVILNIGKIIRNSDKPILDIDKLIMSELESRSNSPVRYAIG
jgi:adenine-specific DNA-methyltransferase